MRVQTATATGVAASAPLPLDPASVGGDVGIFVKVGAGGTYTVQVTPDNVFDASVTPTWYATGIAALTAATTDVAAALPFGAVAVRVNQTIGGAATVLKVVSRGVV